MRLFDSHAHLTDGRFDSDLSDVLERAEEAGVHALVTIASDLEDARSAIDVARSPSPPSPSQPRVWATVGVHPHEAERWTPDALDELERLASSERVVAIGETGLDFYYDNAPRQAQISAFRAQLGLAERLALPAVVHSRSADAETAELLDEFAGRVAGVLHCFTGGQALLDAGLDAGWYVSFSGIVTFANYADEDLVRRVPEDRLLVETDSPYLAPVPMRGRRNEPAFVAHVLARVAAMRDEEPSHLADATYSNACRFYGIPE